MARVYAHPDQYASWHRSYHRTMHASGFAETVRGNFNNALLKFDGRTIS